MMNEEDNNSMTPFLAIIAEEIPKLCVEKGQTLRTNVKEETTDDD